MRIKAVVFDRDGVLTHFDFGPAIALLAEAGLSFDEARSRWERWCENSRPAATVDAENELLNGFWRSLCDDLGIDEHLRARMYAFDYMSTIRPFTDARS